MPEQPVTFEVFYDGAWRDITADDDVRTEAPIVVRHGQGDESPAPRPSLITATLDNTDDRYRTSNPVSPLYGKTGRNTPCRVAVDGDVRAVVEASSWVCDQSQDFRRHPKRGKATTEFEGGGLLQRINQWTEPLKSPFREYNEGLDHVIGYWPAEQPRGSTELVSTVPGTSMVGIGGGFAGCAFDSQHRPPGSAPLMDVGDQAAVGVFFNRVGATPTDTSGWQLSWVARYEPLGEDFRSIMYWKTLDGADYRLDLIPADNTMNIGSQYFDYIASTGTYDFGQWTLFTIDAQHAAGSTSIWVNWTNADNSESGFIHTTYARVPSALEWWSVLGGEGEIPDGSTMGHILGTSVSSGGGTDLFNAARIYAWTGYNGEKAAYRFDRLLDLKGIPNFVSLGYEQSTRMGPQPVATLAEHLREIATTEDGLISDFRTQSRLYLLCRYDRYNQTPAVELVPTDLPALPREVTDDLRVHNLVTAVDRSGAEATAEDATGPLGTQPPPAGVGEYRQTVDVNPAAPLRRLPDVANWWMRRGTVDLPRFPQVVVNLATLGPSKRAEVEAVGVGSVITISGFREDVVRLHVLGYTEAIGTHSRRLAMVCAPDQQFDVARYDDASKRMDSRTSTLSADVDAAGTSMTVTFTSLRDAWSTTSTPYDWAAAGERITVTSMGAVTGSGPWTQTATVRRSVNGVRKRQTAGAPIRMHPAQQARYAL